MKVKGQERRLELVLEAQGLERQLRERADQLVGTQPES